MLSKEELSKLLGVEVISSSGYPEYRNLFSKRQEGLQLITYLVGKVIEERYECITKEEIPSIPKGYCAILNRCSADSWEYELIKELHYEATPMVECFRQPS